MSDGRFNYSNYPIDILTSEEKIKFPQYGPITENDNHDENLIISINTKDIEPNIFDDNSGNNNYGFAFSDFRKEFEEESLQPKRRKSMPFLRSSKNRGAY